MDVKVARDEWAHLLDEMDNVRYELHCSSSNAWFRGHSDHRWRLLPSLIRLYVDPPPELPPSLPEPHPELPFPQVIEQQKNEERQRKTSNETRRKIIQHLGQDGIDKINIRPKDLEDIRALLDDVEDLSETRINSKRARSYRNAIQVEKQKCDSDSAYQTHLKELDVLKFCQTNEIHVSPNARGSCTAILQSLDTDLIRKVGNSISKQHDQISFTLKSKLEQLNNCLYIVPGEREAFVDFNFRWKADLGRSWEVLARMQHYGVFTRLLDWTESPSIAIWFALKNYIELYQSLRRQNKARHRRDVLEHMLHQVKDFATPSIWIMNPYELAKRSGRNSILDLNLEENLDYLKRFLSGDWPIDRAIPIYSPWRDERIAAQQGMFTLHGRFLTDIEQQTTLKPRHKALRTPKNSAVRMLKIGQHAAVFGAHQISNLLPLDQFHLFRDMDSFAKVINSRFLAN